MKFFEKYPQLKEQEFLTKILADTVFSTMALEDQVVEMKKVKKIIQTTLEEEKLKGLQFFGS